jgi:Transglycosylase SLT domain
MRTPRAHATILSLALATLSLLLIASVALAEPTPSTTTSEAPAPPVETTTVPAPPQPEPSSPSATTPSVPTTQAPETTTVPAPEVRTQHVQPPTVTHTHPGVATPPPHALFKPSPHTKTKAVSPSVLTPPLPSTLGGAVSGVPSFFIDSFSIPPFLLPIYQAAGAAYGIPWQVLAAINEIETDYGRDVSVSSAGAEGWMQFMPSEWGMYGVDVNNDGFQDPYNPADAIFAAARYLKAAGGDRDIRAAVFAYNHSQAYVDSVLLRARLLGGTPPELLGAVTGLTEARFPVYAAAHYSDGFPTTEGASPHTVAATTIYSQAGAPLIAVQDGRIVQISETGPLGPTISLRDAYGNTYTYAELGTLSTLYPELEAIESSRPAPARGAGLSSAVPGVAAPAAARGATRMFRAGSENVYLHPLRVGVHVIAGTVLGHVGPGVQPHIVFQIRPASTNAPAIDPKPILDGWVKLQSSSVVKAKGRDPFATIAPTPGQVLLESKAQLERQIPRDRRVHLAACERRSIADGVLDRRVLAMLEFLAASGLKPTVSGRSCVRASAAGLPALKGADSVSVDISAIDGVPVAGPAGQASLAVAAVHKLRSLQGVMKPLQIGGSAHQAGLVAAPRSGEAGVIHVAFTPLGRGTAHAAGLFSPGLSPAQWIKLIARLGEVPDPTVGSKPSSAAIPDPARPASGGAVGGN